MKTYEIVVAIKPDLPEAALRNLRDKVKEYSLKHGGKVVGFEDWSKKKLAYPIKNHSRGHYVLFLVHAEPSYPADMERHLKLRDEVLRFIVVKVSDEAILIASPTVESEPRETGEGVTS